MADAGFGGFEIADVRDGVRVPMDPRALGWGSARWLAGVERALEVAARRGLKADITIGAHWPTGMPGVVPDDEAAAKELVHGAAVLAPGQRFDGPLPLPLLPPSGAHMHASSPRVTPVLVALQAWRELAPAARRAVDAAGDRAGAATVLLDPRSRVDLAGSVRDGCIDWRAPGDGTWHLLAFWMRGTAQIQNLFAMNPGASMLAEPVPYVVDVYGQAGAQACIDYWERHLLPPRTRALLRRIGGNLFEDSLELAATRAWSPRLPDEFAARRGYPLEPLLPLLATPPGYALQGVESARLEHDLARTLGQMYAENRVRRLADWAATLGMGFRVQCAGLAASYATVPEGDNGDTLDSFSAKAAARDIGGHAILSDEAATFVGGQSGVANWRLMLFMIQRDYAAGVNQVVLHGFSYADAPGAVWPGFSAFGRAIGDDWGPRAPHWAFAGDITAYIGRLQRVLRSGRPQADVAVLEGDAPGDGATAAVDATGEVLRAAGYTRQHLAAELLEHPAALVSDGVLAPQGAGYAALVVAPRATLELQAARRLLEYARAGLPIVLVGGLPAGVPGLRDPVGDGAVLQALLAQLCAQPCVRAIGDAAQLPAALAAAGLRPSLGYSRPCRVLGQVRRLPATTYYYFLNDSDAPLQVELSLAGAGRPLRIDLWDGRIEPVVDYRAAAGRVDIPVRFDRNEAIVLALSHDAALCADAPPVPVVRADAPVIALAGAAGDPARGRLAVRATRAGDHVALLADGRTLRARVESVEAARELRAWTLVAEQWLPGDSATRTRRLVHRLALDALQPWSALPGLVEASGLGRYRHVLELPGSWGPDQGATLDLGEVGGTFRVRVNGARLPPANQFSARVDIGQWLRAGTNRIEVEVGTNLNNALLAARVPSVFGPPGGDQPPAPPPAAPDAQAPPAVVAPDPMRPPEARYLGAPVRASAPGAPAMAPGAGPPGGARQRQDYGLIGPVRFEPYRIARLR